GRHRGVFGGFSGCRVWSKTYYCNRRSSGRGWLHSPFMGEQLRELSYHLSRRYLPRLHRRFRPLTDGHSQQLVHPPTRTSDDRRQRRSAGRWRSHFSFVGRWCRVLRMALGLARVRLHFSAGLPSAFAFINLLSHFFLGWIADKVNKPGLLALCHLVPALSLPPLIWGSALWQFWFFTAVFTLLDASFPVVWATVGDFFGRRYFA